MNQIVWLKKFKNITTDYLQVLKKKKKKKKKKIKG